MPTGQSDGLVLQLRRTALLRDGAGLSDAELLQSFVTRRDEAAFAALVRRHGPMVHSVCRRVLGNEADAEDAFQATFLVLVRKASSIVPPSMVGNWLYGVAHRTALKARAMAGKRRLKERQAAALLRPQGPDEVWHRLQELLDDELTRLPDRYRVAVVLCDLEGRTLREAARQLGCPQGTVASRLARGRALLARRLTRDGLALTGGLLGALLSRSAAAAVPAPVTRETVKAAGTVAAGRAAGEVVSARVVALAEGVVKSMLLTRLQWTVGLVLVAALGLGATLVVARGAVAGEKPTGTNAKNAADAPKTPGGAPDKTGRIYYHLGGELAAFRPDGTKGKHLGKVADADLWGYQPYTARLSPDGKRVAFGRAVEKQTAQGRGVYPPDKIYLRDATGSERGELLAEKAGSEIHNWTWSADSSKLAFVTWDAPGVRRNWVVDIKTKKVREVKLPRYKTKDGKEHRMAIEAWSPDGASFLASGDGLHLVRADGSKARRLTESDRSTMGGSCRFSPDGRRVLFVRCDPDDCQSLHAVDVATGKSRAVVEAKNFTDMQACWSPDGRRLAYCVTLLDEKGKRSGETSLFVTDVEGKNTTTVLTEKHQPGEVRLVLTDWR